MTLMSPALLKLVMKSSRSIDGFWTYSELAFVSLHEIDELLDIGYLHVPFKQ